MFRTNNPVISKVRDTVDFVTEEATYKGVATKVSLLVLVTVLAALSVYTGILPPALLYGALIFSGFGTFLCVLLGSIFPGAAKITSWIYAFCEGVLIGILCMLGEQFVPGISIMTIAITACVFFSLLILHSSRIVVVTNGFQRFIITAFFSMFFATLILSLVNLFTKGSLNGLFESYSLTLIVSAVYILLATGMLLIDFERIKQAVYSRVDKKYEWTLALGLMVTLIWLFVEIFRFVLIIASRDN